MEDSEQSLPTRHAVVCTKSFLACWWSKTEYDFVVCWKEKIICNGFYLNCECAGEELITPGWSIYVHLSTSVFRTRNVRGIENWRLETILTATLTCFDQKSVFNSLNVAIPSPRRWKLLSMSLQVPLKRGRSKSEGQYSHFKGNDFTPTYGDPDNDPVFEVKVWTEWLMFTSWLTCEEGIPLRVFILDFFVLLCSYTFLYTCYLMFSWPYSVSPCQQWMKVICLYRWFSSHQIPSDTLRDLLLSVNFFFFPGERMEHLNAHRKPV